MAVHNERVETVLAKALPFVPGGAGTVPSSSVPLGFLAAAGGGLWAFGLAAPSSPVLAAGCALVSCTGALATVNLVGGPCSAARAHRTAVPARTDLIPTGRTT